MRKQKKHEILTKYSKIAYRRGYFEHAKDVKLTKKLMLDRRLELLTDSWLVSVY